MAEKEEAIQSIIEKFPGIFDFTEERKKVICNLTKHELPYDAEALTNYTKGKKFQRLHSKMKAPQLFTEKLDGKYKEFFVPAKKSKSRVYCTLTKKEVNKIPHELEKYIAGYKFKKAFYFYKQGKLELSNPDDVVEEENDAVDNEDVEADDESNVPFYALSSEDEENSIEDDKGNDDDKVNEDNAGDEIDESIVNEENIVSTSMKEEDISLKEPKVSGTIEKSIKSKTKLDGRKRKNTKKNKTKQTAVGKAKKQKTS